ncbi:unnamed protein product [Linum tenue]|uniref:RRM domain-containing protein n=1 Tax=Linum tenue TaxID=586396 RepID=A0AAV0PPW2_9ROSI|nr:unnamed protein product [Linum tenue]
MGTTSRESPRAWANAIVGLFSRMLEVGRPPRLSMKVIGFWVWLEGHGGLPDLLTTIAHRSDKILQLVAAEAETMVSFLSSSTATKEDIPALPVTLDISHNEFPLDGIVAGRERVANEIEEICEGTLHELLDGVLRERKIDITSDEDEEGEDDEEEDEEEKSDDGRAATATGGGGGGSLDPKARAWSPESGRAPVEDRCLYVTFSIGDPLSADQIERFFTRRYGRCVERVYIDRGEPPMYGKVYFRASYIPAMILGGEDEVRFSVAGKSLFCKRFRRPGNEDE